MLNDPYHGGTHLPDVTVITPVFDEAARSCSTSARAATMPTSAAPRRARCRRFARIEEEGVLIDNFKLVDGGRCAKRNRALLAARSTRRATRQNLADLRAQIAANEKGVEELRKMVAVRPDVVQAYMGHVQDNAEEAVRRVISA
jgi:5-oxoprolinase (ATP-hydrolysing)